MQIAHLKSGDHVIQNTVLSRIVILILHLRFCVLRSQYRIRCLPGDVAGCCVKRCSPTKLPRLQRVAMASSRLVWFRAGLTTLLLHGARQRVATAPRLVGRAPLLGRAPVALYSNSPGVGGRAGRWVKRQIYTVLILGGVFTGVLVVVRESYWCP